MAKKVKIQVLNPLRGKYKLPYTTGHVVEMDELRAKELIDNKDAQLVDKEAEKKVKAEEKAKAEAAAKEAEEKAKAEAANKEVVGAENVSEENK